MRILLRATLMAALLLATGRATAQPTAGPQVETTHTWSAQAGRETFALRDISRTLRPPDASPVSWRGAGTALSGHFERSGLRAAHLVDAAASRANGFAYVSPTRSVAAADSDFAGRLEVRYEYRRYFFRDVALRGVDFGAGLQGIASRTGFDRHITSTLVTTTRISGSGFGAALSLRLRRWDRVQADATFVNGAIMSQLDAEHSASPGAIEPSGGGSWFTTVSARVDVRLSRGSKLAVNWRHGYEAYQSSHYHYAANRQSLHIGVSYAR